MAEFNVIAKGNYQYAQTSELLKIERFLILRKRKRRMLLLDLRNDADEPITGFCLRVEQFDARGNALGTTESTVKKVSFRKGGFILKKPIALHPACLDFRVEILQVECGDFCYRLGEEGVYATYEKKKKRLKLDEAAIARKAGKDGYAKAPRRFNAPTFVGVFTAILLAASAVFAGLQLDWFKEKSQGFFLDNLQYEFVDPDDKGDESPVRITGYIGLGGSNLFIPNEIEGHPVVEIEDYAFSDDYDVKTVTIAKDVVVTTGAFNNCVNLEKVVLQGNNEIGEYAFENCYNLKTVEAKNLLSVGANAFRYSNSLKSVRIVNDGESSGMLVIADRAFESYASMDEVYIDASVYYGADCNWFQNVVAVDSLYLKYFNDSDYASDKIANRPIGAIFGNVGTSVTHLKIGSADSIPDSFTNGVNRDALQSVSVKNMKIGAIGESAFRDCTNLQTLTLGKNVETMGNFALYNTSIKSFDGTALRTIGQWAFGHCRALEEISLSKNTTLQTIGTEAFYECDSLASVHIPTTTEALGIGVFYGAENLKTVTFGDKSKLVEIPSNAFSGCKLLTGVKLPENIAAIGSYAFGECRALREITIPASVTFLSDDAFAYCYKLFEIENLCPVPVQAGIGVGAFTLKVYGSADEERAPKKTIDNCSFMRVDDTWILLEYVGGAASLTLPSAVEDEGYVLWSYFLFEDARVKELTIPNGVFAVGTMLAYNSALKTLKFSAGNGELLLLDDAFSGAGALQSVDFGDRALETLAQGVFSGCFELQSVAISSLTQTIEDYAFASCEALKRVSGGDSLVEIGESAFAYCRNLERFYFPHYLQTIGNNAFSGCEALKDTPSNDGLLSIGEHAFSGCTSIKTLSLPSTVVSLGANAFDGCAKLETAILSDGMEILETAVFYGCSSLRSISTPSRLKEIGESAFLDCDALPGFYFPDTLEKVGGSAFADCNELSWIQGGYGLTEIVGGAFTQCRKLTTFPFENAHNLTTIGSSAFYDCVSLSYAVLPSGVAYIEPYTFYNCAAMEKVILPQTLQGIGEFAFEGCKKLHEVRNYSSLSIRANTTDYGMVAYNALVVFDENAVMELQTFASNCVVFKTDGSRYWAVDCENADKTLSLNDSYLNEYGYTIEEYAIARYAFEECKAQEIRLSGAVRSVADHAFTDAGGYLKRVWLEKGFSATLPALAFRDCYSLSYVVAATSCGGIEYDAFGASYFTFYYEGDRDEWTNNSEKYAVHNADVYVYDTCIHYDYEWNYTSSGAVNTKKQAFGLSETLQKPTCTQSGAKRNYCGSCGDEEEQWLEPLGHAYDSKNVCGNCGHINYMRLTKDTLAAAKTVLTFENDTDAPFALFTSNAKEIVADAKASAAVLTITAKDAVTLDFAIECAAGCSMVVYDTTGSELYRVEEDSSMYMSITLYEGQSISMEYKNGTGATASKTTIKEIYLTALNEPKQE